MSTTATSRTMALAILSMPVQFVRALARTGARRWEILGNRWMAKDLIDLTDHELADIGLVREDLVRAFATPLDMDPSTELARIARSKPLTAYRGYAGPAAVAAVPPAARGRIE